MEENNTDWFGELFRDNVMRRHNSQHLRWNRQGDLLRFGQLYRQSRCGQGDKGVNSYSGMLTSTSTLEKGDRYAHQHIKQHEGGTPTPHSLPINSAMETARTIPAYDEECNPIF